jgi:hypothetical protein
LPRQQRVRAGRDRDGHRDHGREHGLGYEEPGDALDVAQDLAPLSDHPGHDREVVADQHEASHGPGHLRPRALSDGQSSLLQRRHVVHPVANLLDQTAPGVAGGMLAPEAALGRLGTVAAPVDETPADAGGRAVRVDAAAAAVACRIGPTPAWGDLGKRFVERPDRPLGCEPTSRTTGVGIPPPDLPAASVKRTLIGTSTLLSRAPNGRAASTYLSSDNRMSTVGRKQTDRRERKKPRCAGLFQCAREDSNLHGP